MAYIKKDWVGSRNPLEADPGSTPITEEALDHLETQYDEAVAYTDEAVEGVVAQATEVADVIATGRLSEQALNATFGPVDLPGGFITPGVRRAQFGWGTASKNVWNAGTLDNAHQRLPIILPVSTKRWRLRIRNANMFGTAVPGVINFTGIWIGEGARSATSAFAASGDINGAFTAAPQQAVGAFATPANGDAYVTEWVESDGMQIDAGVLYLVSMGWSKSGFAIRNGAGGMFYSTNPADASAVAPSLTEAGNVAYAVSIEYEFEGGYRTGVVIGDSLTEGGNAGLNINSWHQRVSRMAKSPIALAGAWGSNSEEWATLSTAHDSWAKIAAGGLTLDYVIIALGANDVNENNLHPLAEFRANIQATVERAQSLWGVRDVYFANVAPRSLAPTSEAIRTAYNDWFGTLSRPVFDISGALTKPSFPTSLLDDSNSGDNVHWSNKGNWRAAQAFRGVVL